MRPGWGRFYVEAKTEGVIAGTQPLGELLRYLVDLPLDAKGKPPVFKKKSVLLFARAVPGRPGELQLVKPDAQLVWDAPLDARLRAVIREFYAPDAPHKVTGVREALHVPGDLAGEGESQLFLATASGEPAACSFQAQSPAAFSTRVNSPAFVAKRLLAYSATLPALTSADSAGQSRQKSGLTQGFDAMRRLCLRRKALMGDIRS